MKLKLVRSDIKNPKILAKIEVPEVDVYISKNEPLCVSQPQISELPNSKLKLDIG